MVKKNSRLLEKTVVDEQDDTDVEMDESFWHGVLDLYFIRGKESRRRQDDDLVFFVRKLNSQGDDSGDDKEGPPSYFVRRWAAKLDNLVGENLKEVDWRRSFYLNLIAHTSFTVIVAICSHQVLLSHQAARETPLSPIYKVVNTVKASPSRVNFQLDSKKGAKHLYMRYLRPFLLRHQGRLVQIVDFVYSEMSKCISAHQAEFQFLKSILLKILASARDSLIFLRRWFGKFPEYNNRDLFIAGESYAGGPSS